MRPLFQRSNNLRKQTSGGETLRQLSILCRQGRLFEVQEWAKQGKPVYFKLRNPNLTPIGIAIDKGFHSLVEVLLQNGVPADGEALLQAVRHGKPHIVDLLFRYGANVNSICFSNVIFMCNPEIVRMFLDRRADVSQDHAVACQFVDNPRGMVNLLKPYKSNPSIHFQAAMALRHFCKEGDARGVSLMLWFGADPRLKVPLEKKEPAYDWTAPLVEAIWNGHMGVVKRIKVDPKVDDLNDLMSYACMSERREMVEYLIGLGANPNFKPEDGETPIQWALWKLSSRIERSGSFSSICSFESQLEVFKTLVRAGAKLGKAEENIKSFRQCLLAMKRMNAYEFIKELKQTGFIDESSWLVILNHPKMRQHLALRANALMELFPDFKPYRSRLKNAKCAWASPQTGERFVPGKRS